MAEGWQDRVMENLVKGRERRRRTGQKYGRAERGTQVTLIWDVPLHVLVNKAAAECGISARGFCRRAVIVAVHAVLGNRIADMLPYVAYPPPHGQLAPFTGEQKYDDGHGIEAMCPHPECKGEHLSPR